MNPDGLSTILHNAAAGDQAAWRELVALYAPRVFGLLRSQCGNDDLAEEITQSAFCPVADKLRAARPDTEDSPNEPGGIYEEHGRFEAWLFRIAMNRLRDEMRRRKRHAVLSGEDELLNDSVRDARRGDSALTWSSPTGGPEQQERIRALHAAMAALPEADRRVLELRHLAEMSFKQIADLLDQPLGTVLARQHRALRKLRSMLGSDADADAEADPDSEPDADAAAPRSSTPPAGRRVGDDEENRTTACA